MYSAFCAVSSDKSVTAVIDCIYLASLRCGYVGGEWKHSSALAPHQSYADFVLNYLHRGGYIAPLRSDLVVAAPYSDSTRNWRIEESAPSHAALKDRLKQINDATPADPLVAETLLELWRALAVAECMAYMEAQLERSGIDFDVLHLSDVYLHGCSHLSIGQLFYVSWIACKDLATEYLRARGNIGLFTSLIRTVLTRRLNITLRSNRAIPNYNRDYHKAASALVCTFTQDASKLGDRFLIELPSTAALVSQEQVPSNVGTSHGRRSRRSKP
jgi:hypothetical protein